MSSWNFKLSMSQSHSKSLLLEKSQQKSGPHPVFSFSIGGTPSDSRKNSSHLDSLFPLSPHPINQQSHQMSCLYNLFPSLQALCHYPRSQPPSSLTEMKKKNDLLLGLHTFSLANSLQPLLHLSAMVTF